MNDSTVLIEEHISALRKDVTTEEAKKLRDAIYTHLKRCVDEIGRKDNNYHVSELLNVGSFHEGTKIYYPDEFDFIAVMTILSEPGYFAVQKKDHDPENVFLEFNNDRCSGVISDSWKNNSSKSRPNEQLLYTYSSRFYKALMRGRPWKGKPGIYSLLDEDFMDLPVVDGVELSVRYRETRVPNMMIEFMYKDHSISVDLSPAIRHTNVSEYYDPSEATIKAIGEMIMKKRSALFVAQLEDFRIIFTEVEVEYVKEKLHAKHKMLYMYLKYFNGKYLEKEDWLKHNKFSPFSSYMLKTICIYHDDRCKADTKSTDPCLEDILDIMLKSLHDGYLGKAEEVNEMNIGFLPSIFNKKKNLYHEPTKPMDLLRELKISMINDLKTVHCTGRKWPTLSRMLADVDSAVNESAKNVSEKTWSNAKFLSLVRR